jgi:hypothetical protein
MPPTITPVVMVIKKSSMIDSFESYLVGYWECENYVPHTMQKELLHDYGFTKASFIDLGPYVFEGRF